MPVYDLTIIRQMLSEAFSIGEINTLAFDLLPKLQGDFSSGMSTSERIQQIVAKADQQGQIPELFAYVKRENAYRYNRFADQLIQEEPSPSDQQEGWQQRKQDLEKHIETLVFPN